MGEKRVGVVGQVVVVMKVLPSLRVSRLALFDVEIQPVRDLDRRVRAKTYESTGEG